jgi:aminoglycoside phosphotransferase
MSRLAIAPATARTEDDWPRPPGEPAELGRFLEAMQPRLMGPRLQQALGGHPAHCHVLDAKYEPGTRAIVLYDRGRQLVRGDLVPAGWEPCTDVVAPGVRLSPFPHDPELPWLPRVMDPAELGEALAEARVGAAPRRQTRRRCRLQLLRYRPGKRVTLSVDWPGRADRYVVKAYHSSAKATAVAGEAPALERLAAGAETLRFAPTVAHVASLDLVVQEAVVGTPLSSLVTASASAATIDAISACARALAELHAGRSLTARTRPVARELHRFAARAERVAAVDPDTGTELRRVAARLDETHEQLRAPRLGPVHGDCKPSQFLCGKRKVYLMDLDHLGVSDQAADVGTFLASMRQLAVYRSLAGSPRRRDATEEWLADRFLADYLDASGRHDDVVRIRWQEAVALERKALRAFARAPLSPVARSLAGAAGRCLDDLEVSR